MPSSSPQYTTPYLEIPPPGGVLGPWLMILLTISYFLGVLLCQTAAYYARFPRDPIWLKALVFVVGLLACAQWAIAFCGAWIWFVVQYGGEITSLPWAVCAEPVVSQLGVFGAQLFFAHRCYHLTNRSLPLGFGLLAVMLTTLGVHAYVTVLLINPSHDPWAVVKARTASIPALALGLCTDVMVTGCTTYVLLKSSKSGINPNTETAINKIIATVWEAAIPPVIAVIMTLALRITMGEVNIAYVFFNMLAPRLYAFSLLFTLNSRIAIRRSLHGPDTLLERVTTESHSHPDKDPSSRRGKLFPSTHFGRAVIFAAQDASDMNQC